jgi:hypothetical protein
VERCGVALAVMLAHFLPVAEIELDIFDTVEVALAARLREVAQAVPVAGPGHAAIDLAQ